MSASCSALSNSRVVFIPIDAAIWTAGLPASSTAVDVTIAEVRNYQRALLQYPRSGTLEIRFYPSPQQVLEPVLDAYGGSLIDTAGGGSQAVPISITGFEVLLDRQEDVGNFAVTLQFLIDVAGESYTITAIGLSPVDGRLDTVEIQQAMHDALTIAIRQSRTHIGTALNRSS